jgi:N-acyl-D-aspartate/D-glutamate deacylase
MCTASVLGAGSTLFAIPGSSKGSARVAMSSTFDVVIRGGIVYDGSERAPTQMDVGIRGDRIIAVGKLRSDDARFIDATGCMVTPGFVDVHTHCDLSFKKLQDRNIPFDVLPADFLGNFNYLFQGVTTLVAGNCGLGCGDMNRLYDALDKVRFGSNICYLAPHGEIRQGLFKDSQPAGLDSKQLALMKDKVAEEMAKGAYGLSTGLEYAPGCLAQTNELIELAKVVKKCGGLYVTHIRDLTGRVSDGKAGIFGALDEAIRIGKAADIPVQISHLQVNLPWNGVTASQVLERIYKARKESLDITGDIHSYDVGLTLLNYRLPEKFKTQTGIKDEYKTPEGRKEVVEAVEQFFAYIGPDKIRVFSYEKNPAYRMKFLSELPGLPGNEGKTPAQCYVDIVSSDSPDAYFYEINPDVMRNIIPQDHVFMASDGWTTSQRIPMNAHPRCYDNFTRVLWDYTLKEKRMDIQTAVRKMTALPAEKFGITKRGRIIKDYFADIVVIDLNGLKSHATFENPRQYSSGIKHLLVTGVISIEDGKATGQRAGRGLRRT